MIKHVEFGKEAQGTFKGHQFIKIYVDKSADLEKAHDTVMKTLGAINQISGLMAQAKTTKK